MAKDLQQPTELKPVESRASGGCGEYLDTIMPDGTRIEFDALCRQVILCFPKVEGTIEVASSKPFYYVWNKPGNGSYIMMGRFRTQEEANAVANALRLRQRLP